MKQMKKMKKMKKMMLSISILLVGGCADIELQPQQEQQQIEESIAEKKPQYVLSSIKDIHDYKKILGEREQRGYFFSAKEIRVLEARGFVVDGCFILSTHSAYEKPIFSYAEPNKTFVWYSDNGSVFRRTISDLGEIDLWNAPEYQGELN